MGGSKAIKLDTFCPNCEEQGFKSNPYQIIWRENHGIEEVLETHCNQCGWAIDSEGNIRNSGKVFKTKEG